MTVDKHGPRRRMHKVRRTGFDDLAVPNEYRLVREDAFRVHWNNGNILECNDALFERRLFQLLTPSRDCPYQSQQSYKKSQSSHRARTPFSRIYANGGLYEE